jgi:hypothetical protein
VFERVHVSGGVGVYTYVHVYEKLCVYCVMKMQMSEIKAMTMMMGENHVTVFLGTEG